MNVQLGFPVASNASTPTEPTNACVQMGMKHSLTTQTAANPFQVLLSNVFVIQSCIQIICGEKKTLAPRPALPLYAT